MWLFVLTVLAASPKCEHPPALPEALTRCPLATLRAELQACPDKLAAFCTKEGSCELELTAGRRTERWRVNSQSCEGAAISIETSADAGAVALASFKGGPDAGVRAELLEEAHADLADGGVRDALANTAPPSPALGRDGGFAVESVQARWFDGPPQPQRDGWTELQTSPPEGTSCPCYRVFRGASYARAVTTPVGNLRLHAFKRAGSAGTSFAAEVPGRGHAWIGETRGMARILGKARDAVWILDRAKDCDWLIGFDARRGDTTVVRLPVGFAVSALDEEGVLATNASKLSWRVLLGR